ncbi:gamma subclass chorismate mutase AroQ [Emcibacter sp. SYSU 3D8]|uniref:gamma subclass chorismate mutase AroQ n=1 Tax=Emcibacter sp. SYSU 3D8 TaxID=3133969 RepID=UPI0031FE6CA7
MKSMLGIVVLALALVTGMRTASADQPPAPEIQRFADLILYRLDLGEHVAAWKWRHGRPIEDLEQEARVLDAAAAQAETSGLDFPTARPFLSAQMEASKAVQRRWFAVWKTNGLPAAQPDLDLNSVLRPSIARAGDAILAQLVLVRPLLDVPDQRDHLLSILNTAAHQRGLAPGALSGIAETARKVAYAAQGSLLDRIMARKQLRVGTTGDYAPFTIRTADGWSGIDVDLARNLAASMDVELVFVQTTWPTLMQDLKSSKFDIGMGGISRTQERQREAFQSRSYLNDGKTPIVRCGDEQKYDTLEEINRKGVKVIVNPGGTNERFAQAKLLNADVTVFPDNTRIFDEVAAGRADVMVTDKIEVQWQAARNPKLCAAMKGAFNLTEKAYVMPQDEALLRAVDAWLDKITADGTLKATFDKYLKKAPAPAANNHDPSSRTGAAAAK